MLLGDSIEREARIGGEASQREGTDRTQTHASTSHTHTLTNTHTHSFLYYSTVDKNFIF